MKIPGILNASAQCTHVCQLWVHRLQATELFWRVGFRLCKRARQSLVHKSLRSHVYIAYRTLAQALVSLPSRRGCGDAMISDIRALRTDGQMWKTTQHGTRDTFSDFTLLLSSIQVHYESVPVLKENIVHLSTKWTLQMLLVICQLVANLTYILQAACVRLDLCSRLPPATCCDRAWKVKADGDSWPSNVVLY